MKLKFLKNLNGQGVNDRQNDYRVWGAMLEKYHNLRPKPKTIRELKVALELVWEDLPQEPINKAIENFTETQNMCGHWWWTH